MSIKVVLDKCTGCTICVKACPTAAIKVVNKKAIIDLDKCTLCGICVDVCKFKAIEILATAQGQKAKPESKSSSLSKFFSFSTLQTSSRKLWIFPILRKRPLSLE